MKTDLRLKIDSRPPNVRPQGRIRNQSPRQSAGFAGPSGAHSRGSGNPYRAARVARGHSPRSGRFKVREIQSRAQRAYIQNLEVLPK